MKIVQFFTSCHWRKIVTLQEWYADRPVEVMDALQSRAEELGVTTRNLIENYLCAPKHFKDRLRKDVERPQLPY